jgi:hypothetical protein
MKKRVSRKLNLHRETVLHLSDQQVRKAAAGAFTDASCFTDCYGATCGISDGYTVCHWSGMPNISCNLSH